MQVAPELLGKVLVHRTAEGEAAGRIVEAEAYAGPHDKAAHSFGGRRTDRTAAMYLDGGHAYVFFLYGLHWAMNVVCAREGEPEAVLVRALEPLRGLDLMAARRGMGPERRELTNGPGKVCSALGIGRAQYGADLCARTSTLFVEDAPPLPAERIGRGPRINVDYAGEHAGWHWRYWERGSPYVSVKPRD